MPGNNSLQILRGTREKISGNTLKLLPGQLLYNNTDNYLTIGSEENSDASLLTGMGNKAISGKPITVPTVEGCFKDIISNRGIFEISINNLPNATGHWYLKPTNSATVSLHSDKELNISSVANLTLGNTSNEYATIINSAKEIKTQGPLFNINTTSVTFGDATTIDSNVHITEGLKVDKVPTESNDVVRLEELQTNLDLSFSPLSSRVDGAEATIEMHTTQISGINVNIEGISAAVGEQTTAITSLQNESTQLSQTITETQTNLSTLEQTATQISANVIDQSSKITSIQGVIEGQSTKITELESNLSTLEQTATGINATVTNQSTTITQIQNNAQALSSSLDQKTGELGTQISGAQNAISGLQEQTNKLDETLKQQGTTIEQHTTQIANLAIDKDAILAEVSQSIVTEYGGEITNLGTQISNAQDGVNSLQQSTAALNESLTTTQGQLNETNNKVNSLQGNVDTLTTQTNELSTTLGEHATLLATHTTQIAGLSIDKDSITAEVKETITNEYGTQIGGLAESIEGIQSDLSALEESTSGVTDQINAVEGSVNTKLSDFESRITTTETQMSTLEQTTSGLSLEIKNVKDSGISAVTTSTGYTFDQNGLSISKSDSPITTEINNDGMTVKRFEEEVLIADDQGVQAIELHANTYLVVCNHIKFQDYDGRMGCFWVYKGDN